jgi:hypothetical protein
VDDKSGDFYSSSESNVPPNCKKGRGALCHWSYEGGAEQLLEEGSTRVTFTVDDHYDADEEDSLPYMIVHSEDDPRD